MIMRRKNFFNNTREYQIWNYVKRYKYFVLVSFIIFALTIFLLKSNLFLIKTVNIVSNNTLFDLQVDFKNVKNEQFLNKHFFLLRLSDKKTVIQNISPLIKDVYIEKVFPNKIRIYVYYYSPAYIVTDKKKCYIASDNNKIFYSDQKGNCDLFANSETIKVVIGSEKILFPDNTYLLEDIYKIKKVFAYSGWDVKDITVQDQKYFVNVGDKKVFILDMADPLDIQLKKVLLLTDTIVNNDYKTFKVYVGYEKPFLEKY